VIEYDLRASGRASTRAATSAGAPLTAR
jgi:hypothetical protein